MRESWITKEYFKVAELSEYSSISQRTLHTYLNDPINPIPHYRIGSSGRLIRIKKSEFDDWMQTQRSTQTNDIDDLVAEILKQKSKTKEESQMENTHYSNSRAPPIPPVQTPE